MFNLNTCVGLCLRLFESIDNWSTELDVVDETSQKVCLSLRHVRKNSSMATDSSCGRAEYPVFIYVFIISPGKNAKWTFIHTNPVLREVNARLSFGRLHCLRLQVG